MGAKWIATAGAVILLLMANVELARASFTETYEDGTDVGQWVASFNVPRQIELIGGSPLGGGGPEWTTFLSRST